VSFYYVAKPDWVSKVSRTRDFSLAKCYHSLLYPKQGFK
jgi:ribosome-binding factor A